MPGLHFEVRIHSEGMEKIPEMAARMADFTPVFANVISLWAEQNEEKFLRGEGMETAGVAQTGDVYWEPLKPATSKAKRRAGMEDAIMTATGALRAALTSEDSFSQYFDESKAIFGTPLAAEEELKAGYNWLKRPTIFLDQQDTLNIRREFQNYLTFGENYRDILFAKGLENQRLRDESAQMDIDFGNTIG